MRSEIGVLYVNHFNRNVIQKILREGNLVFHPLFEAKPHVFISSKNPLAARNFVTLEELIPIPIYRLSRVITIRFIFQRKS